MKKLTKLKFLPFLLLFIGLLDLHATHIRGGQILYEKISALTFQLTFVGYRDQDGVLFGQGVFDFGDGTIFGDDEDEVIPWSNTNISDLGNGIERWEFTLVHTYPSSGVYVPSYTEDFRTADVRNMSNSLEAPFYVEAMVLLDPLISNSSPQNYESPDVLTTSNTRFISNLMMFDEEGDSLSYSLVVPKNSLESVVEDYRLPSDLSFYNNWMGDENPEFSINPITGNLEWDTPNVPGLYSIVVKSNEWRKINGSYIQVGSTTIDYLVEVLEIPPAFSLTVPDPTCQSVNTNYNDQITIANDQNLGLSVTIFTENDAFRFDGLTSKEWNESSRVFIDSEINIDVELLAEDAQSSFNSIYVRVTGKPDFVPESITTTAGLAVGIGCSEDDLIVLGMEEENESISLAVSSDGVQINSDQNRSSLLLIHDLNGKELHKSEQMLTQGDNVVKFTFELYQVYFILLDYKKGSITEKVLLTK